MRRTILGLLSLAVCIGFTGCKSPPKVDSDETMFDYLQDKATKVVDKGGVAAVGIGQSQNIPTAQAKARLNARLQLAQLVHVKIENLEKQFVEEVGEARGSEMNELFSSATKQVTAQSLSGTVPIEQPYDTHKGITTAYVLMVLKPSIVDESLRSDDATKHLYERFRASKAFEELDKEIKEYEEAERSGMLGM